MSEKSDLSEIEIRSLATPDDYDQCVRLQRETWGRDFTEIVPPTMLKVPQKVGGVSAGAFGPSGEMVGFVYGVSGLRRGRPAHWSHMLAVAPKFEGRGLGVHLKAFQRGVLLDLGIDVAYWSYDPLEARNAHLNLNRLAARMVEYVPNMYGEDTHSPLHSGLGTDRFVVEWELEDLRVDQAIKGVLPLAVGGIADTPAVASHAKGDRILPTESALPDLPTVRIEVPESIQAVKAKSMELGMKWRNTTRRAFLWYLGRSYRVTAFYRDPSSARCFYVVSRER
jgi:predicted GNAT superfamily acetyltransferase